MFRDTRSWTRPTGRDRVVKALTFYVDEARKTSAGPDLFGDRATAELLAEKARERQYDDESPTGPALFSGKAAAGDGERVRPAGGDRDEPGVSAPVETERGERQAGRGQGVARPEERESREDAPDDGFAATFMRELAQVDDLFQYDVSTGTTLNTVFAGVDPSVEYIGETTREDEGQETGADQRFLLRTAKGNDFYVMQTDDEVWIVVSRMDQGEGGNAVYAAVGGYAFNTGRTFIGDPAGLSFKALRRRTDNMLSSALKHGTTRHLAPHQDQMDGHPKTAFRPCGGQRATMRVIWQH